MTTALDLVFVPLAKQLIGQFGASATFRRETRTYDVAPGKPTTSDTDTTVKLKPPEPYNVSRINGSTVQEGDRTTMIDSTTLGTIVPTTNDKIVYLSTVWQIVNVAPIVSGDQTAAYELQIRQ